MAEQGAISRGLQLSGDDTEPKRKLAIVKEQS